MITYLRITIDYPLLGMHLREARLNNHLHLQDLSEMTHIGIKHISNVENGHVRPSLEVLVVLADALNASVDELLEGCVSTVHDPTPPLHNHATAVTAP